MLDRSFPRESSRRRALQCLGALSAASFLEAACSSAAPGRSPRPTTEPTTPSQPNVHTSPSSANRQVSADATALRKPPALTPPPITQPTVVPSPVPVVMPPSSRNGPTAEDLAARDGWMIDRFTPDGGKLPLSFRFGGKSSHALLPTWQFDHVADFGDQTRVKRTYRYRDPMSKVQVRAEVTTFGDYPAVEWVLYLRNDGTSDTAILENIQALDVTVSPPSPPSRVADFVLHHSRGSTAQSNDFAAIHTPLGPGSRLTLAPDGGRSSDGVLPFFNLELPSGGGIIIAVGWSGQWKASFVHEPKTRLRVRAGMEYTHFKLHAGEEVRSPRILLLFWAGEHAHSQNVLRRLLLTHYVPRKGGKRVLGPIWAGNTDPNSNSISETDQIAAPLNIARKGLPVEAWEIDAGWFVNGWPRTGTWEPDPQRFPRGLRPVADQVHRLGMEFILWFEPERVVPNTWLANNHPEWLLKPGVLPEEWKGNETNYLLNLGNPDALAWVKEAFTGMIRNFGVDIYRHDFNMPPLYCWRNGESSDRQGMTEIRYITGFYNYWDHLLKEIPGLVIDNSASGGRRLDLETISRSISLFRTDDFWDTLGDQDMTVGLTPWVVYQAQGADSDGDTYMFRGGMGSSVVVAFDFVAYAPWRWLKRMLTQFQSVREYFYGDFYPLTPGVAGQKDAWMAYQFDRPDLGEGMVLAFRRPGARGESVRVKLRGLDPSVKYEVHYVDAGKNVALDGVTLLQAGLSVISQRAPGSELIVYRMRSR